MCSGSEAGSYLKLIDFCKGVRFLMSEVSLYRYEDAPLLLPDAPPAASSDQKTGYGDHNLFTSKTEPKKTAATWPAKARS